MSTLKPIVLDVIRDKRLRMADELRRMESGEIPGASETDLEILRDKVRELDALLRDHAAPLPN